jgi:mannose-1-phosphate guanylyltransferase
MLYPIILSGGVGKRLWPVSNQDNPKQFQKLFNDKTLVQNTYDRLLKGFDKKDIFIVANEKSLEYIKSQFDIDDDNLLAEPAGKGTAAAIGLAAAKVKSIDPQGNLVIINSDHFIKDEEKYIKLLRQGEKLLDGKHANKFVLAGVKPSYPETGYGYIKPGKKLNDGIFLVDSFKEKPDLKTAQQYINEGFLWNPAIFLFKAGQLLDWYSEYLPDLYSALTEISKDFSQASLAREYAKLEKVSIDYGLLEKMDDMLVISTDLSWADIGHWRSLRDVLVDDKGTNVSNIKNVSIDSKNNLLYSSSNKLIATVGVEDMVLVETEKAILLCAADRAQDIKALLEVIKKENLDKYL